MVRITPLDLRKQEFKQGALGLNRDQVHEFLELAAEEMENLIQEKNELQERLKIQKTELDKYKDIEKAMHSALVMAKDSAGKAVKSAEKEAAATIEKARTEKNALLFSAREQLSDLQNQIHALKLKRDGFIMNFKTILRTYQEALEIEFSRGTVLDREMQTAPHGVANIVEPGSEERIIDFSKTDLTISDLSDKEEAKPAMVPGDEPDRETDAETEPTGKDTKTFEKALHEDLRSKPGKAANDTDTE